MGRLDARISVEEAEEEFDSLAEWLGEERELRGLVTVVRPAIGPNEMGSLPDVVAVAVGAGGAGTALVAALTTWLQSRRTSVRVKVETPERTVTFDATTIRDVLPLLDRALGGDDGGA